MRELLEAMEGYDSAKEYVVAKHSASASQLRQGRRFAGEIPDSTGEQSGTMQVWELNPKPVVDTKADIAPKPKVDLTPEPKVDVAPKPKAKPKAKLSLAKRISNKLKGTK